MLFKVLGTLTLTSLAAVSWASAQDFEWKGTIARGKTLEVRGINGPVRATLAAGPEAEVTAVKKSKKGQADEVKIEQVEEDGNIIICAVYPSRKGRGNNRCESGGGHNGNSNNDTEVAFTVNVPAGVDFEGETVNGSVSATGLKSDVEVSTVNGSVDVSTTGSATGTTVNGDVTIDMGTAGDDMTFETVNGDVTVTFPSTLGAKVKASTVNGGISTDFPITIQGKMGARSIKGTIGDGTRSIDIETVNGDIRLRKASQAN